MRISEISDIFIILKEADNVRYTNFTKQNTIKECKEFIELFIKHNKNEPFQYGPYTIHVNRNLIGLCGIEQKSNESATSEIWYLIHKPFWNKGYGSKIADKLIRMARENSNLKKIIAETVEINIASWKILEKLGFKRKEKVINGFTKEEIVLNLFKYELLFKSKQNEY